MDRVIPTPPAKSFGVSELSPTAAVLLVGGGFAAGIVNALAGGGSLLTVPLLVLAGLPGTVANGTNRIGILLSCVAAARRFRTEGFSGFGASLTVLPPIALGSIAGGMLIARVADETFEALFGVVMLLLLFPLFRPPPEGPRLPASPIAAFTLYFAIGLYGGAFQAGIGILLIFALSYAGYDLVRANSIKAVVNGVQTLAVIPVFIWHRQVAWLPALVLAAGFVAGGEVGARLAVRRGERLIRPVLAVTVVILAGKMLGLY
jgi:hypothetical protein